MRIRLFARDLNFIFVSRAYLARPARRVHNSREPACSRFVTNGNTSLQNLLGEGLTGDQLVFEALGTVV